ncbi:MULTISPECIES: hypothetical protein [Streptomyces]|nr:MULTISPECIES: hypothetical protein [Streptomyces]QKV68895.1 hypothetical protein HUT13_08930 [Streptomyces harbinensis]
MSQVRILPGAHDMRGGRAAAMPAVRGWMNSHSRPITIGACALVIVPIPTGG